MTQAGFEPTVPVFERSRTIRASDHVIVVIDHVIFLYIYQCVYHEQKPYGHET
jgi:hypothetical protein